MSIIICYNSHDSSNWNVLYIEHIFQNEFKSLIAKTITGTDFIQFFISDCASVLSRPVNFLINLLLLHYFCFVSNTWKLSLICSIFKRGERCSLVHTIQLQSFQIWLNFWYCNSVLSFYNHVSNVIYRCQHHFMNSRSTNSNLTWRKHLIVSIMRFFLKN